MAKSLLKQPISGEELSDLDTDKLARALNSLLLKCDKIYYSPLTDKPINGGDVPKYAISNIQRMTAELCSRYLIMRM